LFEHLNYYIHLIALILAPNMIGDNVYNGKADNKLVLWYKISK